jgi:hypothetical protein
MFSFAMVSSAAISPAISSNAGAMVLHGPHHSAQKSTKTGFDDCSTSSEKLSSVTGKVDIHISLNLIQRTPA